MAVEKNRVHPTRNRQKQPPEMSYQNSCSWKWRKIHKNCLCWTLFFNKVARWRPATLFKKKLHHISFPENYAKFLIPAFWQNTSWWMLLKVVQVIEIIFRVKLVLRSWEISLPYKFFYLFSHLQPIYFHYHSFATSMTKISSNIFSGMFYWGIRRKEMCNVKSLLK